MRRFPRSGPNSRDYGDGPGDGPDPAAGPGGSAPSGDQPDPLPGNLPVPLDRFVGRRSEAARLCLRMAASRLVTVTGMGGMGKTRLAGYCAARVQNRFCGGVWLVELSTLRDGALLDHAVVEALGLSDRGGHSPRSTLHRHFATGSALLVLDGVEHLVPECAELTEDLLRRSPGLRVLATGRRTLGVAGEQDFPLGPLSEEDAAELFRERASAVLPGFGSSGGTGGRPAAVRELCARLDRIPLAVELAAGRLRALSLQQITQRLDDRFTLLTGSAHGHAPRHRALRTAIGWSHELCTPEERLLWARLSVFGGDFGLEAAEYLCAGGDLPADRVLPALDGLVAQSVVVREERDGADGQARYRLLDTVREYGADWLAELGDRDRLRQRHRDWYLGLATWCELDWFSPRQAEVTARLEQELPNLRVALEYSLESAEDPHLGQYLAGTLWFHWVVCGRLAEGSHWLERTLAVEGHQPEVRAKALWAAGLLHALRADTVRALGALHECLDLAEAHDDAAATAYATQILGCLALTDGDPARAKTLLTEAVERFRGLGELNTLVVLAQVMLALAYARDGETAAAVALGEEAREVLVDSGEQWALSYALYALAHARLAGGERDRATALVVASLTLKRELDDVLGMALALETLALLTVAEAPEHAAELLGAASCGWRTAGPRHPSYGARGEDHGARAREAARAALGGAAYEAARLRGRRRGLRAVVRAEVRARRGRTAAAQRAAHGEEPGPSAVEAGTRSGSENADARPTEGRPREFGAPGAWRP
ncbi:AAA family ATPase [Streptomyces sp. Z26]|uniref:ATP-binding protein n=1 Tax=Streptomyces sp. Z26 TaxID=2500177 RepID=UPI0019D012D9|nr:AAA family ATPase [Streptomyces sp. Z26]